VVSFYSFLEIYNVTNLKIKLHIHIPFVIILYFFISKIEKFDLTDQNLLLIFYIFSSLLIIVSLHQKSNIHFSIVGFFLNSTFFSIIYITSNQILEYKLIYMIVSIISLCDSFAYLIGKRFGKFKIFPKISPNKTIEGYIGSTFCTLFLFVIIFLHYDLKDFNFIFYVIIIIISSFCGDLYLSFFKRKLNIKDFGKLFPGHGGVLDRIDSWSFSFPLSFLILYFS
jgi:phosphatidate cytidylyltransferase